LIEQNAVYGSIVYLYMENQCKIASFLMLAAYICFILEFEFEPNLIYMIVYDISHLLE